MNKVVKALVLSTVVLNLGAQQAMAGDLGNLFRAIKESGKQAIANEVSRRLGGYTGGYSAAAAPAYPSYDASLNPQASNAPNVEPAAAQVASAPPVTYSTSSYQSAPAVAAPTTSQAAPVTYSTTSYQSATPAAAPSSKQVDWASTHYKNPGPVLDPTGHQPTVIPGTAYINGPNGPVYNKRLEPRKWSFYH